jgi:hypothetical protein
VSDGNRRVPTNQRDREMQDTAMNMETLRTQSKGNRIAAVSVSRMKVMSVFASPDRMIGKHLMAGLANLKAAAERS